MAMYEDPLIGPGDMRFLQDMRRRRMQSGQIQNAPVVYERLGGAGMRSLGDMSFGRAEDALTASRAMNQMRTQDLLNRRAADLQNQQLAEKMRFARASRAALPLIEEGQRLFHRNRIQSDDDRFRNLYDPYNSSGDTDQGVVDAGTLGKKRLF